MRYGCSPACLLPSLVLPLSLTFVLGSCKDDSTGPSSLPTADFAIVPSFGWTGTEFLFDASSSTTPNGPDSTLTVRWDWEDDGTWDTAWSTQKTVTHVYEVDSTKTIRLQVRDVPGGMDETTMELEVGLNLAPETMITSVSWPTPFNPHVTWSGTDSDGTIAAYRVGWSVGQDPELVYATDRVFQDVALGLQTLTVAAVDNRGRVDPTPATFDTRIPFIDQPAALVKVLETAYAKQDLDSFVPLLANEPENSAEYLFLLSDPTPDNETQWGYSEEVRIHQRMFSPESPLPGDTPVSPDLWLQTMTITLTQIGAFAERTDLYTTSGGFLDPVRWRASSARFATYLLAELAGQTDYRIEGEALFVVIEDLTKSTEDSGKFLLLFWEDLGSPIRSAVSQTTWSSFKRLYR